MIESVYVGMICSAFLMFSLCFFVNKLGNKMIFLGMAMILFAGLAAASADVEFVHCNSAGCTSTSVFYEENMWIFGFLTLVTGVVALVKSLEFFDMDSNAEQEN